MDPELRDALNQVVVDLRGEIRIAVVEMRRHFEVVAESLRADNRSVAEGTALLSERTDRRIAEETGRTDGLEGRVVNLEVRVSSLERGRKPRGPRRQR